MCRFTHHRLSYSRAVFWVYGVKTLDSYAPLPYINPHFKKTEKRSPLTKSRNRSHYCTDVYVSDTPVTLTESEALKLQGHATAVI